MDETLPPIPEGFELQGQSADASALPPIPEGFQLEGAQPAEVSQPTDLKAQAKTGLRGVAEGLAGPIAPFLEVHALHTKPSEIRQQNEQYSGTHGIGQAIGLGLGMMTGTGEGAVLGEVGNVAKGITGLAENPGLVAKIGAEAVDQAAQMAFLQGSDEISKMIIHDPKATAENAIANVGLATALGGATGAAIGAISPLWKASGIGNKLSKTMEEFKSRANFRTENPNLVEAAHKEFQDLHSQILDAKSALFSEGETGGGIRGDAIAKAMPEVTANTTKKIDAQLQSISDNLTSAVEKMRKDAKVKGHASYLEQDLSNFQEAITNPEATYVDKFNAVDDLKRTMQKYSKYDSTAQDTAFGEITKKLAAELRPTLENPTIWGDAAHVQKDINKAFSEFLPTEKDITSKFTSKLAGDKVIDPAKINTYLNQVGKPNAEIKQEMIKNYLDKSEKLFDTVNNALTKRGLEPQFAPKAVNVLRDSLGEKTPGAALYDKLVDKEIDKVAGKTLGGGVGGLLGGLLGHPGIGYLAGEHTLGPAFSSVLTGMANKIATSGASGAGAKSALDYAAQAVKSQKNLNTAVGNVFKSGSQVLATHLVPSDADRTKLDKQISKLQDNPIAISKVDNGHLGHYLPEHQQAMTQSTTEAAQYLAQLKPKPVRLSPLDREIQPTEAQKQRYNRALDIAQQPGVVLQHIKDGTLQATDVQDIRTMYPAVYQQISTQINAEITKAVESDDIIPYKTRMSLSLFVGQPLDSTMQPSSIQAAQPMPQQPQQPQGKKPSQSATKALDKGNSQYMTPLQSSQAHKTSK